MWAFLNKVGLAQDRDRWRMLVSSVMNLRVPWNAGNFLTSCKPVSLSRRTQHHGVSIWNPSICPLMTSRSEGEWDDNSVTIYDEGDWGIPWRRKSLNQYDSVHGWLAASYSSWHFGGSWWMGSNRPVVTVCSRPKLCTVFCVNNTTRTVGILGLNSGGHFLQAIHVLGAFFWGGGGGHIFVASFCKGSDF